MSAPRSWWGWGRTDAALSDAECVGLASTLPGRPQAPLMPPRVEDLELPRPRVAPPAALEALCSTAPAVRAGHTYGKAFRDVVRALRGDVRGAPDLVAWPDGEQDVADLLEWAAGADVAVVPYGGGSSVVGGTEYRGAEHAGVLSLDLARLSGIAEIDATSRAARIRAGTLGPDLEDALRPHELTLRHFPQSFEFSTLGGWLATRSGGHYATLHTHIDDFTEALRVVTPAGIVASRRLPASGAGPSPDRMFLGSEGALGVITEAWMRLQDRPRHKASAAVRFTDFGAAVRATRAIAQSGLHPANCRLLDAGEAAMSGAAQDGACVLVLGFESAALPVADRLALACELAREHGGTLPEAEAGGAGGAAVESWRSAFLRLPYVRDGLARMSAIVETFETACTWDVVDELCATVREEVGRAVREACGTPGTVNCRFTHVYPDGAAPYFTVIAAGRRGSELEQWDAVKAAASETLIGLGATITHHHAVGRDHGPWYDRQRPEPFAAALRAAKGALDPAGILNPGVLVLP